MSAREIIHDWPKGRSTSRGRRGPSFLTRHDPRWVEDMLGHWNEEYRKSEMMEAYYEMLRIEARGALRPINSGERMRLSYGLLP